MTVGTVKTQGTELFLIANPGITTTDPEIIKFACPTGISGLGGPADQIEDTCLDATDEKTYVRGLGNPGQVTVPFNLIPRDASHQAAVFGTLQTGGEVLSWMVALSEAGTDPTLDTDGAFVAPADRSTLAFSAYIADVNIDVSTNEIVRGTLTLQRSGAVTPSWYTPA
jgi:hypothetical protein